MKARLKSIILSAMGVAAVFTTVTVTSCNDDPCKSIVCAYGGTCADGDCICPSGYEGTHCEIVTREKFKGVWTVFEDGTSTNPAQYEVSFVNGEGATDMSITNFYNRFPGNDVNIRVKGDSMFIPQQTVNGYVIEGWGYLKWEDFYPEHGEITVHYKIVNPEGVTNDFGVNTGYPSKWAR
ncbi:MAG TPA: calcium-binding EGF-like domain-containing protein [Flavipsychrobacter sp.]